MKKTNAVRILDKMKIDYTLVEYYTGNDVSALAVAKQIGVLPGHVFKTLVVRGEKTGVLIASIPGDRELDLKALARISGNKKIEMVALNDIKPLTGYIRGAVSPFGIKNKYPYYLDRRVLDQEKIYISAGIRGVQINLSSSSVIENTGALIEEIS